LVVNPQLDEEVRGIELLKKFGSMLFGGYTPPHLMKSEATPMGTETPM
jgi:hypothetical protein